MKRPRVGWFLIVLLFIGCSSDSEQPPIPMAHIATLTGPNGEIGKQAALGIRLAVMKENKNAKRTLTGLLTVRHTDAKNEPAFEAEAVRLSSVNKVIGLFGGTDPTELVKMSRSGIPIISPLGCRPPGIGKKVYCLGLSPAQKGEYLAKFIEESFPKHQLMIVVDERKPVFVQTAKSLAETWKAADAKNRLEWRRFGDNADLAKRWENAPLTKSTAIVFAGDAKDLTPLLRKVKRSSGPLILAGPEIDENRIANEPVFESVYRITAFAADAKGNDLRSFVADYKEAFKSLPTVHGALAFDSVRFAIAGLRACDNVYTAESLQKQLPKIKKLRSVTGECAFDKNHQLQRPSFIVQLQKGSWTLRKQYAAKLEPPQTK